MSNFFKWLSDEDSIVVFFASLMLLIGLFTSLLLLTTYLFHTQNVIGLTLVWVVAPASFLVYQYNKERSKQDDT